MKAESKPFNRWSSEELLDRLKKMERKTQIKIGFTALGIVILIPFFVWPAWVMRFQNDAQIEDLKLRISSAKAQILLEPKLLEEKKNYEAFIANTYSRLFTEGETQRLLGILTELGRKSKVALLSSQPTTDTPVPIPAPFDVKYRVLSYQISVEGDYHALATFVSEIENYPKNLRVDQFSITPQADKPLVHNTEIRLSVFLRKDRP